MASQARRWADLASFLPGREPEKLNCTDCRRLLICLIRQPGHYLGWRMTLVPSRPSGSADAGPNQHHSNLSRQWRILDVQYTQSRSPAYVTQELHRKGPAQLATSFMRRSQSLLSKF